MDAQNPSTSAAPRASRKATDPGIIVKLTLFVPYRRGDLKSMGEAVTKAEALTTLDGLKKIADIVEIIKAEAREGARPAE